MTEDELEPGKVAWSVDAGGGIEPQQPDEQPEQEEPPPTE
jgi:hypothetical protein